MNSTNIIETAFQVWGQGMYKTTSLSQIAQALGVTKPALYRHFANKKALMEAMYGYYCDHYANFMKKSYNQTMESRDVNQAILAIARDIAEYCVRHKWVFIFSLFEVYGNKNRDGDILNQFALRGIDLRKHWFFCDQQEHPNRSSLIITAVFFFAALFYKGRTGNFADPTEAEIQRFLSLIEGIISHGLGFDRKRAGSLDFEELEKTGNYQLPPDGENEKLLKAVAGAVAQAGPWNASMDMVAKRSGLSKSGLYAHFKNRADMLCRMFMTEFDRIVDHAEWGKSRSAKPEEQFYLVIVAVANYLRSRPEILIAMDWIRTRRLDLDITEPPRTYRLFAGIDMKGVELAGLALTGETMSQWVFFLILNTLMRRPEGVSFSDVPDSSFRILYKFVVLGIEGWE
ncbi:MAG: TetR/AcrR family transcriptional regulator; helix-turn-helix transcriptional regulator [Treponema sp.]|jgi:AcrR family transcriptional regulator|nr:TetR/AcrR family transcriptional regulator; helix-turn-helix transcriptional regulator [Treponema sp.]